MLKVLTWNLFLGAYLGAVYDVLRDGDGDGLASLPEAVSAIYHDGDPPGIVQNTAFERRAQLVAEDVVAHAPDVIGLQEAARWEVRDPAAPDTPAAIVDHLEILEAALASRGAPYQRAVTIQVGDVELPGRDGRLIRLSNRLAILARDAVSRPRSGTFQAAMPIEAPLGTFGLTRGWASVDLPGATRFFTTHLEDAGPHGSRSVQQQQAVEFVEEIDRWDGSAIVSGDFNARPGTVTYDTLLAAGLTDAWSALHPAANGFTCCRPAPLTDPAARLRRRIDLVLVRGAIAPVNVAVVGDFRHGRWPSDHAGVAASLML